MGVIDFDLAIGLFNNSIVAYKAQATELKINSF
jgi:hypothetical protein